MPRKQCYWTRKLELDLIEFVRQRDFIWKPIGNTNHHIQQKYKAYAEFAARLGRGFTARSVRDRWVNIRSTFNHNLRKVDKSRESARTEADVFVPCWPLWKPLQFLRNVGKKEDCYEGFSTLSTDFNELQNKLQVKDEITSDIDEITLLSIRQSATRTDRPRRKGTIVSKRTKSSKCKQVIDDLVRAMAPLTNVSVSERQGQSYWFFGRHVTERLNCMRETDAKCARRDIMKILGEFTIDTDVT